MYALDKLTYCMHIKYFMNITFDPEKSLQHLDKHGVSLDLAAEIEWETAITWVDNRKDYAEQRMAGIGYIELRLYFVVFVDRDDNRRVISLRKANKREENRYANT